MCHCVRRWDVDADADADADAEEEEEGLGRRRMGTRTVLKVVMRPTERRRCC